MRLQKYLADAGIGSRRKCEEYILEGKVTINGQMATLGLKVDIGDKITFEGKPVGSQEKKVYYMLNKPPGYITSVSDERDRKTVLELLPDVKERIFPVGRLDYQTSGLLLLTNDGDFAYALTHPKHKVAKTYVAIVKGKVTQHVIDRLQSGIKIEDYTTAPAKVSLIEQGDKKSKLQIIISEGKNRQVRKMCSAVGHDVVSLERIAVGKVNTKGISRGQFRQLTKKEVEYFKGFGV
ncbi:MAG: pseudouridine synthase [Epulopiscium sp. Nele67-Bin005]|nr:MAG: pseudouridine synthase [Epulopiscium sp. Nele67-Bin005]